MTADDAHTLVRNALTGHGVNDETPGLHELRLADLNETEREYALDALDALHRLDDALAERSGFVGVRDPRHTEAGVE